MSKETTQQIQDLLTQIHEQQRKLEQLYGALIFLVLQLDLHNDELRDENERLRSVLAQSGETA